MIPDPKDMLAFARTLEQAVHEKGWDQPPMLGLIIATAAGLMFEELPDPDMDQMDMVFAVAQFPIDPQALAPTFGDGMELLAKGMSHNTPPKFPTEAMGSFAGLITITEGWANTVPPDERDGRALADIPGTVEIRSVAIIDSGGRVYLANRVRGHEPESQQWEDTPMYGGRVPEAMRDIMLALGRARPGMIDADAVGRVATYQDGQ